MRVGLIALWALMAGTLLTSGVEPWPGWRGPRGDGSSLDVEVPSKWALPEDLVWKTRLPGTGHASPVIWGDAVFIVASLPDLEERILVRIDRVTGQIQWQKTVLKAPLERIHHLNSYASSTPATDGERVYVSFLDRDRMFVAAYDFEGNELWSVRPGVFASMHGFCSSPVLWKDSVIVNGDHDGEAYLVALEKATGKTLWKTPRPNKTRSYCVPIIRTIGGRHQLIFSGSKCVASYDPDTGQQHWIIDGPTEQYVASLVYDGRSLFMTCGYPDRHMLAIDPTGTGNVTETHIRWRTKKHCAYVPSPAALNGHFYVVADSGRASAFDAETGERLWLEKLGREHSASLITANGRVHFLANSGTMTVVESGREFNVYAKNELGEETRASPAIAQGQWFIRGVEHLYCIGDTALAFDLDENPSFGDFELDGLTKLDGLFPLENTIGEPWIGVGLQHVDPLSAIIETEGARITDLAPGGPADLCGLRKHDIVTKWNDEPVNNATVLNAFLMASKVGDEVPVTVKRKEHFLTLPLKIGDKDSYRWKDFWKPHLPNFRGADELEKFFNDHEDEFDQLRQAFEELDPFPTSGDAP